MFLKKFLIFAITISLATMLQNTECKAGAGEVAAGAAVGAAATYAITHQAASTATTATTTVNTANAGALQKFKDGCKAHPVMCGLAILTAVQMIYTLTASHKSKKIADQTKCTSGDCSGSGGPGPGYGTPPGGNPGAGTDLTPDEQHALNIATNAIKDLKERGYTYNPKTNSVDMPGGRSVPASTFSSAEGLRSLGASDDLIASIEQADKKANNNYGSFGYDDGGGGGLRVKKAKGYDDGKGFDMNAYLKSMMDQKNQAGRDVSGLQKQNGSDSIGVAQDDLFKMIHRRYEAQSPSLHP